MTIFRRHPTLFAKIISVVVACALWLYVINEQNPPIETTFNITVEQHNLGPKLIVTGMPEKVKLKVRAPRTVLSKISASDLKAYVELKGREEGKYSLPIQASIPQVLEIIDMQPNNVNLQLDKAMQRVLPVDINFVGNIASNVTVGKTIVSPNEVVVSGGGSKVSSVAKVIAYLDLNDQDKDFNKELKLVALDSKNTIVEDVSIQPDKVSVSAKLLQKLAKGTFPIKINTIGLLPDGVTITGISSEPERVSLTATPDLLAKINEVEIEAIDLSKITESTTLKVKLVPIADTVSSYSEVQVKINVNKK